MSRDGKSCYVTSLWSRRLTRVAIDEDRHLRVEQQLDLPIAPRRLILSPDETTLFVADSFTARLMLIDPKSFSVSGERNFTGHNIRGLAINRDGQKLLVAHAMINDLAHTDQNDVHWGLLMSNYLRWLKIDSVLGPQKQLYEGGHMHALGETGDAAGDPSGLVMSPNGIAVVSLGGVDEIAVGRESDFRLFRIPVGKRPTAVTTTLDGNWAFSANTFGDSVTVVDLTARKAVAEISLGPQPLLTLVEKGELLFYNARLSHDGWMSCHSCHTDGHSNGLLNDNFSDASFGAPKRVLSLLGVHDTAPFAWNGEVKDLSTQINNSLTLTMQSERAPKRLSSKHGRIHRIARATSLSRTRYAVLKTPRPWFAVQPFLSDLDVRSCHAPGIYTTPQSYDVGLVDARGHHEFNPPSLRTVSQRGPYFHDNGAATLEDVLFAHGHQLPENPPEADLRDLLAFLRSL